MMIDGQDNFSLVPLPDQLKCFCVMEKLAQKALWFV